MVPAAAGTSTRQYGAVSITPRAINLPQALDYADIYLSNGGLNGVGLARQKGCWPIVVPMQAEQVAMARNLVLRKWGSVWVGDGPDLSEASLQALFAKRPRQSRLPQNVGVEEILL